MDTDALRGRDHLHLRRRRRRAEGGAARLRGRPALRRRRRSSRSAPTTWTRASCGWPRATSRSATSSPGASRWSTSRCASTLARYDLDTVEGRVGGDARAPRRWWPRSRTGSSARSTPASSPATSAWRSSRCSGRCWRPRPAPAPPTRPLNRPRADPDADSPQARVEREALKLALQEPVLAGPMFDAVDADVYAHPVHAAVRAAIAEAGGAASGTGGAVWIERGPRRVRRPGRQGARRRAGGRAAAHRRRARPALRRR